MNQDKKSQLTYLKTTLQSARESLTQWKNLLERRMVLEKEIEQQQNEDQLKSLMHELKEVDTLMDQHEEWQDIQSIEQLEESILDEYAALFPEKEQDITTLRKELRLVRDEVETAQVVLKGIKKLKKSYQEILEIKNISFLQWVLHMLTVRHPRIIMAHKLETARSVAKGLHEYLQQNSFKIRKQNEKIENLNLLLLGIEKSYHGKGLRESIDKVVVKTMSIIQHCEQDWTGLLEEAITKQNNLTNEKKIFLNR